MGKKHGITINKSCYKNHQWYHYLKPHWMNCITWQEGEPKLYKWLGLIIW